MNVKRRAEAAKRQAARKRLGTRGTHNVKKNKNQRSREKFQKENRGATKTGEGDEEDDGYSLLKFIAPGSAMEARRLAGMRSDGLASQRRLLLEHHRKKFPQWMLRLRAGFSVLLHGLGSKMGILDEFAR